MPGSHLRFRRQRRRRRASEANNHEVVAFTACVRLAMSIGPIFATLFVTSTVTASALEIFVQRQVEVS